MDVLQCDGFYDDVRLRVRSDELYRAYELMYPRDKKIVTPQILGLTGIAGMAALWSDRGRIVGRIAKIRSRLDPEANIALAEWCKKHDFECRHIAKLDRSYGVQFTPEATQAFILLSGRTPIKSCGRHLKRHLLVDRINKLRRRTTSGAHTGHSRSSGF